MDGIIIGYKLEKHFYKENKNSVSLSDILISALIQKLYLKNVT